MAQFDNYWSAVYQLDYTSGSCSLATPRTPQYPTTYEWSERWTWNTDRDSYADAAGYPEGGSACRTNYWYAVTYGWTGTKWVKMHEALVAR
jgi:hypothetical protein